MTDSVGNYTIAGLGLVSYTIRDVVASGYVQTEPAAGSYVAMYER